MGLVGNHCKPFAFGRCQFPHRFQSEGKGLNRADNDLLLTRQCVCKFRTLTAAIALDRGNHTGGSLESVDGIL